MTTGTPAGRIARRLAVSVVLAAIAIMAWTLRPAGAADPSLSMTPGPTSRPYADGQTIALSVGANSRFTPNTRIEVLECAAPKGVLPVDDSTCDGNTAQLGSVLVGADGSFHVSSYTLYQLPNAALGEQDNHAPVCNAAQECVLYLGQDQNDFTKPKMFSPLFTVGTTSPVGTSPGTTGATGGSGSASGSQGGTSGSASGAGGAGGVDPSVSLSGSTGGSGVDPGVSAQPAGVLAFTGVDQVPLLVTTGLVLMVLGTAGIHVRRRVRS